MTKAERIFNQLYNTYQERIYFFVLKRTQNEALAEDIVQFVFLRIWERKKLLTQGKINEAFIFTIARNLLIDHFRKDLLKEELLNPNSIQSTNKDHEPTQNPKLQKLYKAINALPEKRRKIFQLSRFQGLTYKEIADELSISIKTVENQMQAALKTLRENV